MLGKLINLLEKRSDYIIGFVTPAIGSNKSKKLNRAYYVPGHNVAKSM